MRRTLLGSVVVSWLVGCGAGAPSPEQPRQLPPPRTTAAVVAPSAVPPQQAPASVPDAPALAAENVVAAVSAGNPADLAWTGHGSVMVKVPGSAGLKSFYLDRTEVSELAHHICYAHGCYSQERSPGTIPSDPRNAVLLDLAEAKKHCKWAGKRLPTLAELELAAGTKSQKTGAATPKPVSEGSPDARGLYGLDNDLMEWTSSAGKARGSQRVFGLPDGIGEVPIEETRLGVRCAADARDVKPLPPAQTKLELLSGVGPCARLGSTRETWCWDGLPAVLGGSEPAISRQPVRVSDLDTAVELSGECGLWPDGVACAGAAGFRVLESETDDQLVTAFGGAWLLGRDGRMKLAVSMGDERYVPPKSEVKETFATFEGLLTVDRAGETSWGGMLSGVNPARGLRAAPIQLPGTPSAVLKLDEEECLRIGAKLVCGRFLPGRFEVTREVDKPVAAVAIEQGAHCVLLDTKTLHCSPGTLTSAVLAGPLPAPVMKDVDELTGGLGMTCAKSRESVHCFPRALQNQLLTMRGLGSQRIVFERVRLPDEGQGQQ